MSWQACLDEGRVRKILPDIERARSLAAMCERKLNWLAGQRIADVTASPILANYFDVLGELCDTIVVSRGFKVSAASRDCVVCFIADVLREKEISEIYDHYRKIRNRINYYGKGVSQDAASKGAEEIRGAFTKLKSKYAKF